MSADKIKVPLTEEEKAWAVKHMKEDFELGFSRKLSFVGNEAWNEHNPNVDIEEAEPIGYFCDNCGAYEIEILEEHVRSCMHLRTPEDEDHSFLIMLTSVTDGTKWTLEGGKTLDEALIRASKVKVDHVIVNIIKLMGQYTMEETR